MGASGSATVGCALWATAGPLEAVAYTRTAKARNAGYRSIVSSTIACCETSRGTSGTTVEFSCK